MRHGAKLVALEWISELADTGLHEQSPRGGSGDKICNDQNDGHENDQPQR